MRWSVMAERWLHEMRKIAGTGPNVDLLERAERGPALPDVAPRPASRLMIAVFALLLAGAGSLGIFAIGSRGPHQAGNGSVTASPGDANRVLELIGSPRLTTLHESSES